MRKLLYLLLCGVLATACIIIISGEPEVAEVHLMGSVQYAPDFDTSGKFSIPIIALTEDGDVISLKSSNVAIIVDSVSPSDAYYEVTVTSVKNTSPTSKKIAVGLLLDSSGSMEWNDSLELRKDAAKEFIRKLLNNSTSHLCGVFDFAAGHGDANNDGIDDYYFRIICDYRSVKDTVELFGAIESVTAEGGTPLYDAICYLLDHTNNNVSTSYGRAILCLTDGEDNDSYNDTSDVISKSIDYGIPVYGVGLGDTSDIDFSEFKETCERTGGVFAYAIDPDALDKIFTAMGTGLTEGYTLVGAQINPVPEAGHIIYCRIEVNSGGSSAYAHFVIYAP